MSDHEIDEDDTVPKSISFFKEPIKTEKIKECPVDEEFLSNYEEMKADEKTIKDNLEIMNSAIKAARMPGESTLTIGKMAAFFTDVEGKPKIDWEKLAREELGDDRGRIDPLTLAKYSEPGKPQVRVVVKRLGT